MKKLILAIAVSSAMLLGAGTASAATVNYNGSNVSMGTVQVGQSGSVSAVNAGGLIINSISGGLPSNSMITFTYNFSGNVLSGLLGSAAEYSYNLGGNNYYGNALSLQPSSGTISYGMVNGATSNSLVIASAQIDFATNTASTIITNNSSGLADYASIFTGLMIGGNTLDIAYSVSAVPLPAALPLFGAGLGALAGFGAWKRKKAAA